MLAILLFRYSVMLECWQKEAKIRPSFAEIVGKLTSHLADKAGYLDCTVLANDDAN